MSETPGYASPKDFRTALTAKLRTLSESGRWTLPQLQRQFAYDRLLARLYVVDGNWIVKGATALLARGIGGRSTIDIDLYRDASLDIAERELRTAAALDLGDWFRFEIGAAQALSDGPGGRRLPVTASVGTTVWQQFRVDVVGPEVVMTGTPEHVGALAQITMRGVNQAGYIVYPLVDHIADKVCAMFESHGESAHASTRTRDLADLVAIVHAVSVSSQDQLRALRSESARRALALPEAMYIPNRTLWEPGYARLAKDAGITRAPTLDEAVEVVKPFLNPLLNGTASGSWDVSAQRWG